MKKFLLLLFASALTASVWAQERVVSGRVTSQDDGSAMPGVNVVLKGTTNGTVTDADGNYKLSVPTSGGTLVFSFIGFASQEVEIGQRSTIDLGLVSDSQTLSEVVVTSHGIEREKKALGYSVSTVSGTQMQQRSEPDPLRTLQGKMPGVVITGGGGAPGQSTKINIRGYSTMTGNTQPLFVVDGIPFNNDVNQTTGVGGGTAYSNRGFDLDPNNIETLTVLKGAAAAALYGSRATNGVVIITTKAGKKASKKGMEISYNGSYNVENITGIPDYQDVYTQGSNQNYSGAFIGNWGTVFPAEVDRINGILGFNRYSKTIDPNYPENTVPHPVTSTPFAVSQGYPAVFPELMEDTNGDGVVDRAAPVLLEPHDIVGQFFKQGHVIENGISINNSTEKVNLNASLGRMTQEGIIDNQEASRTNMAFGGSGTLDNGLFLSGSVSYTNTKNQGPQGGFGIEGDYGGGTGGSLYDRLFYLPRNYNLMGYPFENPITGGNVFYRPLDNPRWVAKYNLYSSNVDRAVGNITMGYDVTEWFNVTFKGGVNTYAEQRRNIVRKGGVARPLGEMWTDDLSNTEQDYNLLLNFEKQFSESVSLRAIVGGNANERYFRRRRQQGTDFIVPNLYTLTNTATQVTLSDAQSKRRLYGVFADLGFTFIKWINVNVTARNDWASTLPEDNRSFFYPGVSTSFVLTDATDALDGIFSFAKVRAAYTQVGREADPYLTATVYGIPTPFTSSTGTSYRQANLGDQVGNLNLVNEATTEIEFGAELKHKSDRVGLDIAWFKRNSSDQITNAALAPSSGFTSAIVNAGEIENTGWEVGLSATPVKLANGFQWDFYAAFTRIRSNVIDAGQGTQIVYGSYGYVSNVHREGSPFGQIFGLANARTRDGQLLIQEATGRPYSLPSSAIIGDPTPDFQLGFNNTFTWKGISLNALLDWKQGGQVYSFTASSLQLRGQLKSSEDREAMRVVPGIYGDPGAFESDDEYTEFGVAILDENGQVIQNTTGITPFDYHFSEGFGTYGQDEVNVYDATTIRLREVSLGYSIPKSVLSKTPFGSARISVSGRNLWWNAPNILEGVNLDPEVLADFASTNANGIETGGTPTTKRFGVNLNLTF
jgi:TonB-linked SusC/RagA family outer membrane protein